LVTFRRTLRKLYALMLFDSDKVNAIIFLAAISAFDQVLVEVSFLLSPSCATLG
jgi:hypothetical protein